MTKRIFFNGIISKKTCGALISSYDRLVHSLKIVWKDGALAWDSVQYDYDAQTIASSEERSCLAQSKMVKRLSYLGLQDAVRKRKNGSK